MNKYVVDTNVFSIAIKNLPMNVFDDIWEPWSRLAMEGRIISVHEVFRELQVWIRDGDTDEIGHWLVMHKHCFLKPSNREGYILQEIFKSKKFREGIKEKSLRSGSPEADAFLVAKAKHVDGIVVTAESDTKPHSEKIPNIATAMGVPYMKIDEFYKMLRNIHNDRGEADGVFICRQLGVAEPLAKSTITEVQMRF